jgi:predicted DNA-binding transcriptional regulator AlpA
MCSESAFILLERRKSTIYAKMGQGLFPSSIKIGERRVVWLEHEIDAMMREYVTRPSQEELRAFVKTLEAKRLEVEVSDV